MSLECAEVRCNAGKRKVVSSRLFDAVVSDDTDDSQGTSCR